MNARCCCPPGEPRQRPRRERGQPDAIERERDRLAVLTLQTPEQTKWCPPRLDNLTHGHRRVQPELGALREIPDAGALAERSYRFAEQRHLAARGSLEPKREPEERRLAAAVRAGDRDELAGGDLQLDVVEHRRPLRIGEVDVVELDR